MSIFLYTCFISLSRAGNCDVNSEVIAERKLEEAGGTGPAVTSGTRAQAHAQAF